MGANSSNSIPFNHMEEAAGEYLSRKRPTLNGFITRRQAALLSMTE